VRRATQATIRDAGRAVRRLEVRGLPDDFAMRHGGGGAVAVFADRRALVKRFGDPTTIVIAPLVDFAREDVVLVSWTTAGPPEGELVFEVLRERRGVRVAFRVRAPRGAEIRGMRARIGADFFALPKGWKATFDPKERP